MKFSEFTYKRPNYEQVKTEIGLLIAEFEQTTSAKEQLDLIFKMDEVRQGVETMARLSSIRYSVNTKDEFYSGEREYWDEHFPLYDSLVDGWYKVLVNSEFRAEIEEELGAQFYALIDSKLQSFSPEIINDLQEENRLASQYDKLLAEAVIEFNGESLTLPALAKYGEDEDRSVREKARNARYKFFSDNEAEFDEIYDQLVKVRTKMAKTLGFENFIPLGYLRMQRAYTQQDVENFRKQVLEHIVPLASELYETQRERLGYDELRYFDETFEFATGNPTPKGTPDWILAQGQKMYRELSPETAVFFDFMMDGDLIDVLGRPNKQAGGYCSYVPEYKAPFIFANFNGTKGDIDVLTHEAGHAFQAYESRNVAPRELRHPSYDSCEIHSMSMEFFTWDWMENFFKEDTKKYKYAHLGGRVKFIPYGVTVDAFQHVVYGNPDLTPKERKSAWRDIEKQYLPHKNYEGCDYLEQGGWWQQQLHVFRLPFYYIDYTLAQICALQFWKKMRENRESAWNDYVKICQIGGKKSFIDLVAHADLKSPFEDGCVSSIIDVIGDWLEKNKEVE